MNNIEVENLTNKVKSLIDSINNEITKVLVSETKIIFNDIDDNDNDNDNTNKDVSNSKNAKILNNICSIINILDELLDVIVGDNNMYDMELQLCEDFAKNINFRNDFYKVVRIVKICNSILLKFDSSPKVNSKIENYDNLKTYYTELFQFLDTNLISKINKKYANCLDNELLSKLKNQFPSMPYLNNNIDSLKKTNILLKKSPTFKELLQKYEKLIISLKSIQQNLSNIINFIKTSFHQTVSASSKNESLSNLCKKMNEIKSTNNKDQIKQIVNS